MRLYKAYLTLILISTSATQSLAAPPTQAGVAGFTQLRFDDEFSSLDLSPDGTGNHRWYNGLWYRSTAQDDSFNVRNGILIAKTPPTPITSTAMAFLTTWPRKGYAKNKSFHYGYFEARIKFNPNQYNWPAFWLLSDKRPTMGGASGSGRWCEIDIFEGGQPHDFWGTVHDWNDNKSTENSDQHHSTPPGTDYRKWNIVGALWEPGKISWFLNNKKVGSVKSPKICDEQSAFLIIGAQRRKGSTNPTSVDIDWVRVYR